MEIKIVRSKKRRRTVSARLIKSLLIVHAPHAIPQHRLEKIIAEFKIKFEKKMIKERLEKDQNLADIASRLNKEYFANSLKINSIEYVTNQNTKFGCCNHRQADIRISHKVGLMPGWVRDYVIIHELAHLVEPNHSKSFWEIVNRYKFSERAKGYLLAAGLDFTGDP